MGDRGLLTTSKENKINISECLSLHTAIYLTLSARVLTTWSLEHRTTMGKKMKA